MRVRYTPLAERHMRGIAAYLRTQSPVGMRVIMRRIRETTELLIQFPEIGRPGVLAGTREIVVPGLPYIIVHRLDPDAVVVLGIYHGAQIRPGQAVPDDDS